WKPRGARRRDRAPLERRSASAPDGRRRDRLGAHVRLGDLLSGEPGRDGTRGGRPAVSDGGWKGALTRYKVPLIALKILLSVALFAYVVAKVSPGDILATIRPANPRILLAAALLFLFSNLLGSWLWARLLRAQGVPIPYRKAASYYFVGLFFNNFLP